MSDDKRIPPPNPNARPPAVRPGTNAPARNTPAPTPFDRVYDDLSRHSDRMASDEVARAQRRQKDKEKETEKPKDALRDKRKEKEGAAERSRQSKSSKQLKGGKAASKEGEAQAAHARVEALEELAEDASSGRKQDAFGGPGGAKTPGKFDAKFAELAAGRGIPPEVLEQMIQFVRMGLNEKGEKEFRIDLHNRLFRNTVIKVSVKNGKVTASFKTPSKEAKDSLSANLDALKSALREKGLELGDVEIV